MPKKPKVEYVAITRKEPKVILPKHVSIWKLDEINYILQYSEFCYEPTLEQLAERASQLTKIAEKHKLPIGNFTTFVREGEVAIGAIFESKLSVERLEKQFNTTIFERE